MFVIKHLNSDTAWKDTNLKKRKKKALENGILTFFLITYLFFVLPFIACGYLWINLLLTNAFPIWFRYDSCPTKYVVSHYILLESLHSVQNASVFLFSINWGSFLRLCDRVYFILWGHRIVDFYNKFRFSADSDFPIIWW